MGLSLNKWRIIYCTFKRWLFVAYTLLIAPRFKHHEEINRETVVVAAIINNADIFVALFPARIKLPHGHVSLVRSSFSRLLYIYDIIINGQRLTAAITSCTLINIHARLIYCL